jgi:hypothetical protein
LAFLAYTFEVALYFFDVMAAIDGSVYVWTCDGDIKYRPTMCADEMMMKPFVDVVSEL